MTMIPHPFALFRSDANDSAPPFEFGIVCLWSLVGLMLTGFFLAWGSGIDISQALVPGG